MAEVIRMPEVLTGATEAAIHTWLVEPGASVQVEQALAEVETDKATVELAAESAGEVGRLLAAEGSNIAVGEPILVLVTSGEGEDAIDAALAAVGVAASELSDTSAAASPEHKPSPASFNADSQTDNGRRLFVSPLVRRLARAHGVDLDEIRGTGPNGRIVRRDFEAYLRVAKEFASAEMKCSTVAEGDTISERSATDFKAPFEDVPLGRMRKAIARRLTESKSSVPHFYLVADCNVDSLLKLRTEINATASRRISINDFILKATAQALVEVPDANAIWHEDSIRRFTAVDISVAVAIDEGLMTPVVRGVDRRSLSDVSADVTGLAEKARSGRLKQHEIEGGSFAISNLGMYGTGQFSAILNPPQSGILAVGAVRKAPTVGADGEVAVASMMTVTLSADHRVLDGAVAANWLRAFQTRLENPLTILI